MIKSATNTASAKPMITFQSGDPEAQHQRHHGDHADAQYPLVEA